MSEYSTGSTFDVGAMISSAWQTFTRHAGAYVGATVCLLIVGAVVNTLAAYIHQYLVLVFVPLVLGPLYLGLARMALNGARGQSVQFNMLFEGLNNPVNAALANLLVSLLISVLMFCLVGLFVIPLYVATFFFMADGVSGFWDAMESSRKLAMGNYVQWLIIGILVLVIFIAGFLACVVGLLVAIPVALILVAQAYDQDRYRGSVTVEADPIA